MKAIEFKHYLTVLEGLDNSQLLLLKRRIKRLILINQLLEEFSSPYEKIRCPYCNSKLHQKITNSNKLAEYKCLSCNEQYSTSKNKLSDKLNCKSVYLKIKDSSDN